MTKFCSECGNNITNESVKFCPKCGHHFTPKNIPGTELPKVNQVKENILDSQETNKSSSSFNRRNTSTSVSQKKEKIELKIGGRQIIIILLLIGIGYGFYYYSNNKTELNEKIKILFSKDTSESIQWNMGSGTKLGSTSSTSGALSTGSTDEALGTISGNYADSIGTQSNTENSGAKSMEDFDAKAKKFLESHYEDIASHNFTKAYSHYDRNNIIVNTKKVIDSPNSSLYTLESFSKLWRNITTAEVKNFSKLPESLTYSYDIYITYNDGTKEVYNTSLMKLKKSDDGLFSIITYNADLRK